MAKGKAEAAIDNQAPETDIHDFVEYIDDPLLTLSAAGNLIGKSRQSIGRWIDEGLVNFWRDPTGLRRVRKSELLKFYGATALAQKNPIKE